MNDTGKARIKLLLSLSIFGTIGIFSRYISMSSGIIALARSVVGVLFLLLMMLLTKNKFSLESIKRNLLPLILSGFMLGFNWVFLFEAYKFTTVPTATLCYYFAPILVVIAAPFVFKEAFSLKKALCVLAALAGMFLISGMVENGLPSIGELKGIIFGFAAAVLYAAILLLNKKIEGLSTFDRTVIQIGASAVVLSVYCLVSGQIAAAEPSGSDIVMLIAAGIVYTGIPYYLYFDSMSKLPPQTVAILGYIDPIVALILSAVVLGEQLTPVGMIGAVMILGAAVINELPSRTGSSNPTKP